MSLLLSLYTFNKIINEYERKYGTVRLPKVKKGGDVSKVFDLS